MNRKEDACPEEDGGAKRRRTGEWIGEPRGARKKWDWSRMPDWDEVDTERPMKDSG